MNYEDIFSRVAGAIGSAELTKLQNSSVIVFGLGGVGSIACEALARSGIGRIGIVDNDIVDISNINRLIAADISSVGKKKTQIMRERILNVNPSCRVDVYDMFYLPENASNVPLGDYGAAADAVDTVSAKLEIVQRAKAENVPLISCMGTGNKFEITHLHVGDITQTSVCPLAKVMRYELKKRGVGPLRVVWSDEKPVTSYIVHNGRNVPSSMMFVPAAAGLIMARECVRFILEKDK